MREDRAGETVADQVMVSESCVRLLWSLNEAVLWMRIQNKILMTPLSPPLPRHLWRWRLVRTTLSQRVVPPKSFPAEKPYYHLLLGIFQSFPAFLNMPKHWFYCFNGPCADVYKCQPRHLVGPPPLMWP